MPVRRTGGGYRWGSKGKLYKGKGAKKRAIKQGLAAMYSQRRSKRRGKKLGRRTLTLRDIFG